MTEDIPTGTADAVPPIELVAGAWDGQGRIQLSARRKGATIHTDRVSLGSSQARKRFVKETLGKVPRDDWPADAETELDRELLRLAEVPPPDPAPPPADAGDRPDPAAVVRRQAAEALAELPPGVIAEARTMLADPNLLARVVRDFERVEVFGERELATTVYLIGVSRLLPRPLAGIVHGPTASGKSYIPDKVSTLFPPTEVMAATQMSKMALAYLPPGALYHKWIVAGERSRVQDDDRAEATRLLRELLQAGRLVIRSAQRADQGVETKTFVQDGPVSYTESTTLEDVFEEDGNRTLALRTDDSRAQTELVVRRQAERAADGEPPDAAPTRAVHRAVQLLLQEQFAGVDVRVPFAPRIAERFDCARVDARRHFGHLINLTRVVALLHAFQREQSDGGLVATPADYQVAARLAAGPFKKAGGGLSPSQLKFLDTLRTRFGDNEFTSVHARFGEAAGKSTIDGWLAKLTDEGLLELTFASRGGRGNPSRYQLVKDGTPKSGLHVPRPEDVFAG